MSRTFVADVARLIAVVALAATGCGGAASSTGRGGGGGSGAGVAGSSAAGAGGAAGGAGSVGAGGSSGGGGAGGGSGATGAGGAAGTGGSAGAAGGATAGAGGSGTGGTAGGGRGGATAGAGGTAGGGGGGATAGTGGTAGAGGAGAGGAAGGGASGTIVKMLDVADVWSGHPVGFALLTTATKQYAAYYDANRDMTVAQRALTSDTWTFTRLPTTVGWDSHNYIAMAIDSAGYIHVSGNMHAVPLIYFRSMQPNDTTTFSSAPMVGSNESSCTYPLFFHDTSGNLVFNYRDGMSGNGNHIFNIYDTATKTWRRLLNAPFTDGEGQRSAYPVGPVLGPDGWWHMVWVWRDTPDASTNHDLSYARSQDLVHWQTAAGKALTLPITLATGDIVDPVPSGGGMINNNTKVGFDAQNRAIVAYHKYDAAGNTQLYNARFEGGRWVTHQTSTWSYRWAFSGQGTLVFEIEVEPVTVDGGVLKQRYYHARYGGWGAFALDATTLAATATLGRSLPYPVSLETVESTTAGMGVRWQDDSGAGPDATVLYMLRWETLDSNRDMARSPPYPPPSRLRLYGFKK
jgi:hypothetical protein